MRSWITENGALVYNQRRKNSTDVLREKFKRKNKIISIKGSTKRLLTNYLLINSFILTISIILYLFLLEIQNYSILLTTFRDLNINLTWKKITHSDIQRHTFSKKLINK